MEARPSLVVLSTHDKDMSSIVKGILEVECVPEPSLILDEIKCWQWDMDNKYYTASVQLAAVSRPDCSLSWILKHGEALLVYCDSSQTDVLERLNGLLENVGDFEPEVQLLVCDACTSEEGNSGLSRLNAQQWCISNGWELIELNPVVNESEDSDTEDDFPESWGFKRIRQALHAHTWSNLNMKDCRGSRLNAVLQAVASMEDKTSDSVHETDEVLYSRLADMTVSDDELVDPIQLGSCLEGEDSDFENLFSNFVHLKRTAATLPPNQQRDFAEKVSLAFWKILGSDEDEVDRSDSD
ncbi:alpha- and gamma-adaptin-binding protein p34-like isoform X2 [Homarus americanus]|uniref:alpha- and gamma-adaptin-binding protein p34-like isoform X2 n=1 Tax=Homarus americanus TaxID=6706 RepID=UPI001C45DDEB|nr:alpha- and gamma-adaptin-binding protein p34-like isoform X2 [Homarus americanus]